MLLVDDRQRQILECDFFLKQSVGADQKIDVADRQPLERIAAFAAALAAGQDGDAQSGGLGQRRNCMQMLPRQNFRRRHEGGLPAGLDHGGGGEQRHDGLASTDIALQQPQHAVGRGEVGDDLVNRALLGRRQRVGQGLQDACTQAAFARGTAARQAALVGAHQRERELAGKEFVIGKPRPSRALRHYLGRRARIMQALQRGRERRKLLTRQPRVVLPFGQRGQPVQCRFHGAAQLTGAEAFGERINRLDQRQIGEPLLVDHAVGMHHLEHTIVKRGDAGNIA